MEPESTIKADHSRTGYHVTAYVRPRNGYQCRSGHKIRPRRNLTKPVTEAGAHHSFQTIKYQQPIGKHHQKRIPTGKLFELCKIHLTQTVKGIGFIIGKCSNGYFAFGDISGKTIFQNVTVKEHCYDLAARSTTLIQSERSGASSRPSRARFLRRRWDENLSYL